MLDFGRELAAMKANRADSNPLSLNADIANLDIAFSLANFDALGQK